MNDTEPATLTSETDATSEPAGLNLLADVSLTLQVRLGRLEMRLGDALRLGPGSVVDLQGDDDERVELVVNGKVIGRGILLDAGGNYAVRIESLASLSGDR